LFSTRRLQISVGLCADPLPVAEAKNISHAQEDAHIADLRKAIDEYLLSLGEDRSPHSLYDPVRHVLAGKGKRVRPLLTLLVANAYGVAAEVAMPGAVSLEVFHNFTLVHDDIMDRSDERRGRPTVHVQWGVPAGILVGDYMLAMAYDLLMRLPDAVVRQALVSFSRMVVLLCEGQALDAEFESSADVRVDQYLDMISRKTGALLVSSLKLGGIIGGASDEDLIGLERVGHHLGLAFQIQDDLLDLVADSESWGKPIGTDLVAGKRAYLLLRAVELESKAGETWFRSVMEEGGLDRSRVDEAKARMNRLGVLEDASRAVQDEYHRALEALRQLNRDEALRPVGRIIEQMQTRIR